MFSPDKSLVIDVERFDIWDAVTGWLNEIAQEYDLGAIVLIRCQSPYSIDLLSCAGIPIEPLRGTDKNIIFELLQECMKHEKSMHSHKIPSKISAKIKKLSGQRTANHLLFLPFSASNNYYAIFCFTRSTSTNEFIIKMQNEFTDVILFADGISRNEELIERLKVLELYVKEVGHDFSSSVQSSITKLRLISTERIPQDLYPAKAKEAEEEIWAAYRNAENLGIIVDAEYKVSSPTYFNFVELAEKTINQYTSEANERNITISKHIDGPEILTWGDEIGLSTAISHYMLNAIKYAYGSSEINITIQDREHKVYIGVKDKGIKIDKSDFINIWKFGFRGRKAKERHVNGSGIGLYTVKKIIDAHSGRADGRNYKEDFVIFEFEIPKSRLFHNSIMTK